MAKRLALCLGTPALVGGAGVAGDFGIDEGVGRDEPQLVSELAGDLHVEPATALLAHGDVVHNERIGMRRFHVFPGNMEQAERAA